MRYSLEETVKGVPEGERGLSLRKEKGEQRNDGLSSKTAHGSNVCPLDRSVLSWPSIMYT